MYKCAVCKDPIRSDTQNVGIQCTKCGSKIFFKERPNTRKVIISG